MAMFNSYVKLPEGTMKIEPKKFGVASLQHSAAARLRTPNSSGWGARSAGYWARSSPSKRWSSEVTRLAGQPPPVSMVKLWELKKE